MSNYKHFLKDFPDRCEQILTRYYQQAAKDDVEVTLMLGIAAAGFVIAFEGLRDKNSLISDPSQKYPEAWKDFDDLLVDRFLTSDKVTVDGTWELAEKLDSTEPPWETGALTGEYPLPKEKSMFYVLDLLRNALAHGNMRTYAEEKNQIKTLVFIAWSRNYSEKDEARGVKKSKYDKNRYDMLAVSPQDFCKFLIKWLTFLKELVFP